jgi:hypothetical protein
MVADSHTKIFDRRLTSSNFHFLEIREISMRSAHIVLARIILIGLNLVCATNRIKATLSAIAKARE